MRTISVSDHTSPQYFNRVRRPWSGYESLWRLFEGDPLDWRGADVTHNVAFIDILTDIYMKDIIYVVAEDFPLRFSRHDVHD